MTKFQKVMYYLSFFLLGIFTTGIHSYSKLYKRVVEQNVEITRLEEQLAECRGYMDSMNFREEMEEGEYGKP